MKVLLFTLTVILLGSAAFAEHEPLADFVEPVAVTDCSSFGDAKTCSEAGCVWKFAWSRPVNCFSAALVDEDVPATPTLPTPPAPHCSSFGDPVSCNTAGCVWKFAWSRPVNCFPAAPVHEDVPATPTLPAPTTPPTPPKPLIYIVDNCEDVGAQYGCVMSFEKRTMGAMVPCYWCAWPGTKAWADGCFPQTMSKLFPPAQCSR